MRGNRADAASSANNQDALSRVLIGLVRYTQAVKIDPNLGEAYLGWGYCLVNLKKYEDAIAPLRTAERLIPANPEVHHSLGTALERSGHKDEAQKEFALHEKLRSEGGTEKPE